MIPGVAASGTGGAQTGARVAPGYGPAGCMRAASGTALGRPAIGGESPVRGAVAHAGGCRSTTGHEEPSGKARGPPRKAKYLQ